MKLLLLFSLLLFELCVAQEAKPQESITSDKIALGKGELYWLLNRSCCYGDEIGVKMLLNAGADIDGKSDYEVLSKSGFGIEPSWPINLAAGGGHKNLVKFLLDKGAKVDNPEGDGGSYTALTFAVSGGHTEIVKLLLNAGADTTIKSYEGSVLDIAIKKNHTEIIKLLKANKAKQTNL